MKTQEERKHKPRKRSTFKKLLSGLLRRSSSSAEHTSQQHAQVSDDLARQTISVTDTVSGSLSGPNNSISGQNSGQCSIDSSGYHVAAEVGTQLTAAPADNCQHSSMFSNSEPVCSVASNTGQPPPRSLLAGNSFTEHKADASPTASIDGILSPWPYAYLQPELPNVGTTTLLLARQQQDAAPTWPAHLVEYENNKNPNIPASLPGPVKLAWPSPPVPSGVIPHATTIAKPVTSSSSNKADLKAACIVSDIQSIQSCAELTKHHNPGLSPVQLPLSSVPAPARHAVSTILKSTAISNFPAVVSDAMHAMPAMGKASSEVHRSGAIGSQLPEIQMTWPLCLISGQEMPNMSVKVTATGREAAGFASPRAQPTSSKVSVCLMYDQAPLAELLYVPDANAAAGRVPAVCGTMSVASAFAVKYHPTPANSRDSSRDSFIQAVAEAKLAANAAEQSGVLNHALQQTGIVSESQTEVSFLTSASAGVPGPAVSLLSVPSNVANELHVMFATLIDTHIMENAGSSQTQQNAPTPHARVTRSSSRKLSRHRRSGELMLQQQPAVGCHTLDALFESSPALPTCCKRSQRRTTDDPPSLQRPLAPCSSAPIPILPVAKKPTWLPVDPLHVAPASWSPSIPSHLTASCDDSCGYKRTTMQAGSVGGGHADAPCIIGAIDPLVHGVPAEICTNVASLDDQIGWLSRGTSCPVPPWCLASPISKAAIEVWSKQFVPFSRDMAYLIMCVPSMFGNSRLSLLGGRTSWQCTNTADKAPANAWDRKTYCSVMARMVGVLESHKMWHTLATLLRHAADHGVYLKHKGRPVTQPVAGTLQQLLLDSRHEDISINYMAAVPDVNTVDVSHASHDAYQLMHTAEEDWTVPDQTDHKPLELMLQAMHRQSEQHAGDCGKPPVTQKGTRRSSWSALFCGNDTTNPASTVPRVNSCSSKPATSVCQSAAQMTVAKARRISSLSNQSGLDAPLSTACIITEPADTEVYTHPSVSSHSAKARRDSLFGDIELLCMDQAEETNPGTAAASLHSTRTYVQEGQRSTLSDRLSKLVGHAWSPSVSTGVESMPSSTKSVKGATVAPCTGGVAPTPCYPPAYGTTQRQLPPLNTRHSSQPLMPAGKPLRCLTKPGQRPPKHPKHQSLPAAVRPYLAGVDRERDHCYTRRLLLEQLALITLCIVFILCMYL